MVKIFLRAPYNYDTVKASKDAGLECKDLSKAQQHQKEESDINTIVKRFGLTGELPSNVRMPQYGDFTAVSDYHSALNAVQAADEAFRVMPASVRSRFQNDPEQFVLFCLDEKNREEAEALGLVIEEKKVKKPSKKVQEPGPAPSASSEPVKPAV